MLAVNCSSKYFTWVGKITLHERHKTRNRHRKYLQTHQQLSRAWNKSFKNCGKMPFIMISFPGPQIYVRSRRTSTRSSTEQRPMLGVASAWNVSPCSTWVWTTSVRSPCSLVIPSGWHHEAIDKSVNFTLSLAIRLKHNNETKSHRYFHWVVQLGKTKTGVSSKRN